MPILSLDDLVSAYGPADVLKIDVEGAEIEVLRSGPEAMKHKPAALIEFNALCLMAFGRINPADALAEIKQMFPRVCRVLPDGVELAAEDYPFLCEHILRNGSVDDLICSFT